MHCFSHLTIECHSLMIGNTKAWLFSGVCQHSSVYFLVTAGHSHSVMILKKTHSGCIFSLVIFPTTAAEPCNNSNSCSSQQQLFISTTAVHLINSCSSQQQLFICSVTNPTTTTCFLTNSVQQQLCQLHFYFIIHSLHNSCCPSSRATAFFSQQPIRRTTTAVAFLNRIFHPTLHTVHYSTG